MFIPHYLRDKYINNLFYKFKHGSKNKLIYRLITGIAAIHITTNHVIDFTLTSGPSMEPLIDPNGTLVIYTRTTINRLLCGFSPCYKRGDVIIAKSIQGYSRRICKRIVGLEGDKINDIIIPSGHVWVEGDAKNNSFDSRHYGPIPLSNVVGRVKVIFSIDSMKFL